MTVNARPRILLIFAGVLSFLGSVLPDTTEKEKIVTFQLDIMKGTQYIERENRRALPAVQPLSGFG